MITLKEYGYGNGYRRPQPRFEGYVLHFRTPEAKALFDNELSGQISDGMYENSASEPTWIFWTSAETVADGTNKITKDGQEVSYLPRYQGVIKDTFSFKGLFEIVGDRMLSYIKAAKMNLNPSAVEYFESQTMAGAYGGELKSENFDEIPDKEYWKKYVKPLYDQFKTTSEIKKALSKVNVTKVDYANALKDVRQTMQSTRTKSVTESIIKESEETMWKSAKKYLEDKVGEKVVSANYMGDNQWKVKTASGKTQVMNYYYYGDDTNHAKASADMNPENHEWLYDSELTEAFGNGIVPDAPDDDHKPFGYKGFRVRWSKAKEEWILFNKFGEEEWEAGSRKEAKDFIDSYEDPYKDER